PSSTGQVSPLWRLTTHVLHGERRLRMTKGWMMGAAALVAVAGCEGEPSELPACEVSVSQLGRELRMKADLATARAVYERLADRAATTRSLDDLRTLRVLEETHYRELGLSAEDWFGASAA